jgi:hypothetical protein
MGLVGGQSYDRRRRADTEFQAGIDTGYATDPGSRPTNEDRAALEMLTTPWSSMPWWRPTQRYAARRFGRSQDSARKAIERVNEKIQTISEAPAIATGRNVSGEIGRWLARTGILDPDLLDGPHRSGPDRDGPHPGGDAE